MASTSPFSIEPVHPPQQPGLSPRPSSSSPSKQSLPCFEFLSCLKTDPMASSSSPGHSSCPEPSRLSESSDPLQCLEFLSCLQTDQIIPIHKINDVVIPTLIHNLSNCNPILCSFKSGDRPPLRETYDKIKGDLDEIKATLDGLEEWEGPGFIRLNTLTRELMHSDWEAICSEGTNSIEDLQTATLEVHKMVKELKSHISLHLEAPLAPEASNVSHLQIPENTAPILKWTPETDTSPNFKERYVALSPQQQQRLLYFSFFPENSLIRKKVPTYMWMGENLLQSSATADWEELIARGFIDPVGEKDKGDFHLCSMKPDTRSALLKIARDRGFFDSDGNPTAGSRIAWLEKTKDGASQHLSKFSNNHEKLLTLFNINESCLDFPRHWLSETKNLSVIHLGNWRSSSTEHYIEAERPDFLDHLGDAKLLRCLSLRGICGIRKLPNSIFKADNLNILDLKSCRDLEKLPNEIGRLSNQLTHLDVSGCYLLDEMPEELALLSELRVLKGFIICPSRKGTKQCTLSMLAAKLGKLRKLSLYADKETTGEDGALNCLSQFQSLRILVISWIVPIPPQSKPSTTEESKPSTTEVSSSLPTSLEKLDLRCWPLSKMPSWIKPCELKNLKKLYIRGGKLSSMQVSESQQWMVKILRLKFLKELRMDWGELSKLFPSLVYLEKVDCPHLSSFPFEGVWRFQNGSTSSLQEG